jgi:ATP-dependent DNA helicase RecG
VNQRPPLRADDPVDRIVGIGPKTASALAALGVHRVLDIAMHIPRRYEDRGSLWTVDEAKSATSRVLIFGRVTAHSGRYVRRRLHISDGEVCDDTGRLAIRWFNQPWMVDRTGDGVDAFLYGAVSRARNGRLQMVNPEIHLADAEEGCDEIVPIYPKLGPLSGRRLRKAVEESLACLRDLVDPVPEDIRRELALVALGEALADLHRPRVPEDRELREELFTILDRRDSPAHRRLAFDELLAVATVVTSHRERRLEQSARPISVDGKFLDTGQALLPFDLTPAQQRVVGEIVDDLGRSVPMARLLQGDVGSGKTAVALLAILAVLEDGRQAALMAPTELLAEQLHRTVSEMLRPTGHRINLLTGSLPAAERRRVIAGLADGSVRLVVGTHALFQEGVDYPDLGLVVIDEQHRFGVAQRQSLLEKGSSPHLLVMTATPIPRSLALTLYGDLELSVIDQLPPGRRPVRTEVRSSSAREKIWRFLRSEIDDGGQAYLVYPLIEASETLEASALEAHEASVRQALGDIEVGVLHGRLDRSQREGVAARFRNGELKVILATTVVEVGVDVPDASVMVIESADRFGLSQLHQLRGRVGRGDRKSWCILITGEEPTADAQRRLGVLQRSTDGFEIAEADLRHRGPGELTGLRQWGSETFRFADLLRHHELVVQARAAARRLAREDDLAEIREALLRLHPIGASFSIG